VCGFDSTAGAVMGPVDVARAILAGMAPPRPRSKLLQQRVHVLLGRVYSDAEWEALCNHCGECCYKAEWVRDRWVATEEPCSYLRVSDNHCRVYSRRFEAEPECSRVTPSVVLQGMLPEGCTYVDEMHQIIEDDFEGEDPRLAPRAQNLQNPRERRRARRAARRRSG